jgi:hypothetical protein
MLSGHYVGRLVGEGIVVGMLSGHYVGGFSRCRHCGREC